MGAGPLPATWRLSLLLSPRARLQLPGRDNFALDHDVICESSALKRRLTLCAPPALERVLSAWDAASSARAAHRPERFYGASCSSRLSA